MTVYEHIFLVCMALVVVFLIVWFWYMVISELDRRKVIKPLSAIGWLVVVCFCLRVLFY